MIMTKRIIYVLLVLILLTMLLTSCFQGRVRYTGDYPELFSVAIGSVLGTTGYEMERGGHVAAGVVSIEEDRFGRVLFRYSEEAIYREVDDDSGRLIGRRVFVYIIAHKVDGDHVYFYPHYNFIIRGESGTRIFESYFEDIPLISNEDLSALKEVNSWNQEMSDDTAFDRVRIVRQKEGGPLSRSQLADARLEIFPDAEAGRRLLPNWIVFLRMDRYGRSIYSRTHNEGHLVVLFQPDHSLDVEIGVLEIPDRFNYQTELRIFMEANGWNTTWVEP